MNTLQTMRAPGIVVPPDWRWAVANWPPELWGRWRALATEALGTLGGPPDADAIRAADRFAYLVIAGEETNPHTPEPS